MRWHFYNITEILNCVTCERCRLHGKLQFAGVGAAIKLILNNEEPDLSRNEIIALINLLIKLSNSIAHYQEMLVFEV